MLRCLVAISFLIFAVGCPQSATLGTCRVITHPLRLHPHRTIQDSANFKTPTPDDDYKDLDNSLAHVPAQYELTLAFGANGTQKLNVVADAGSSNLIVQGSNCEGCSGTVYTPTSSATAVGKPYSVDYGSGSGVVQTYTDTVGTLCGDPVQFTFGVLTKNNNLPNVLGLGYRTSNTLPTFFGTVERSGEVANLFSMLLCGQRSGSHIILGDNDHRVDTAALKYAPITEQSYFVLPFKSMRVKGGASLGTFPAYPASGIMTIIDSGTTLNLVSSDMYNAIVKVMLNVNSGVPNAFFTSGGTGSDEYVMPISDATIALFPTLQVELASTTAGQTFLIDLPPANYFKSMGNSNHIFGFRAVPQNPGSLLILGQVFMESTYVVFDRKNARVGFGDNTSLCGN